MDEVLRSCTGLAVIAMASCAPLPASETPPAREATLVLVHEDFAEDPGWEGVNNRIASDGGPIVRQHFGYRSEAGEIGGTVWASTTSAWYGVAVGPASLRDAVSASGRIAIRQARPDSGAFLGLFNTSRQGWRPWSSMTIGLAAEPRDPDAPDDAPLGVRVSMGAVTGAWRGNNLVTDLVIPADGSLHAWSFSYDPDGEIDPRWPHSHLPGYFTRDRLAEDALLANARLAEPGLSREALRRQLEDAARQGLVVHDRRRAVDYWTRRRDVQGVRGTMTLAIDGRPPRRMYLAAGHRDDPTIMDRFGLVNVQIYGRQMELAVTELTVNGRRIDLGRDPGGQGHGNLATFIERDFHARQDFGYSVTNWAGEAAGEIGGTFWRTEPVDPLHGHYATPVGSLTLDDPISFAGSMTVIDAQPDSGVWFGYFRAADRMTAIVEETTGHPSAQSMGVVVEGPTRVGHYFAPFVAPTRALGRRGDGPVIRPDRRRHRFSFTYDPAAGHGRITMSLDGQSFSLDLTREQRLAGATFDRFGIATMRRGGKLICVYLDDLSFIARRSPGETPRWHRQETVVVPFPDGGRKH